MNTRTLLLIPAAALALGAASTAGAYVAFRLNVGLPLPIYAYQATPAYYYTSSARAQTVGYDTGTARSADQVTPSPGPGYVWMAGHWNNVSQRWVWVAGHWEMPPSPSAAWVAGHWVQGPSGWVWMDGAWAIPAAAEPQSPPVAPGSAPANAAPMAPPAPPQAEAVPMPGSPPPASEMSEGTVVDSDPPAPIVEYVPAAPYPDWVWVGGFWGWNRGWFWHAGHYAARPYRGAAWVSGRWARGAHGWAWHRGRWH